MIEFEKPNITVVEQEDSYGNDGRPVGARPRWLRLRRRHGGNHRHAESHVPAPEIPAGAAPGARRDRQAPEGRAGRHRQRERQQEKSRNLPDEAPGARPGRKQAHGAALQGNQPRHEDRRQPEEAHRSHG